MGREVATRAGRGLVGRNIVGDYCTLHSRISKRRVLESLLCSLSSIWDYFLCLCIGLD